MAEEVSQLRRLIQVIAECLALRAVLDAVSGVALLSQFIFWIC